MMPENFTGIARSGLGHVYYYLDGKGVGKAEFEEARLQRIEEKLDRLLAAHTEATK